MKKSFFFVLCAATLLLTACGGGKKSGGTQEPTPVDEPEKTEITTPDPGKEPETNIDLTMQYEPKFKIQTTEGDLIVKLYEETPLHKDNFIKLAQKHFYDGILFHPYVTDLLK